MESIKFDILNKNDFSQNYRISLKMLELVLYCTIIIDYIERDIFVNHQIHNKPH